MKIVAIVQARMGSTRFPNKVMHSICGVPLIGLLLERLSQSKEITQIIIATTTDARNQSLVSYVEHLGYTVFQGDEEDVLDRYYKAARLANADVVVRITGDCPLVDPGVTDAVIRDFLEKQVDFACNFDPPTFPDGLDTAVFSSAALEQAWNEATERYDREHVVPYIQRTPRFAKTAFQNSEDFSAERWTVDEPSDLDVIEKVFSHFSPRRDFTWQEIMSLRHSHPHYFSANKHLVRDEGAQIGKGQKLWKRAKYRIPGGSMLLSKRGEMFLPDQWPSYFSRASGCSVWDLDGRELIDVSLMGVGTNTLGYGHPEVDAAVSSVIGKGNLSTLNCPEEVYLAERLVELHPWADMVRLARTGGEANAVAIRIARAATGKDKVAFCGYHGWHDWYLAANLGDESTLAGHLLPGLEPRGVPAHLRGSIFPFRFNQLDELQQILQDHDIGVIKMEVSRNMPPRSGFLESVRELATKRGIVLIFDECTSGFRQTFGGLHKLYGVEPDMAVFGKALGNGYAITAVIGRRSIMESAQATFISSTFWTERIGPTAALKTLEVMESTRSWDVITEIGNRVKDRWRKMAEKNRLELDVWGLPALAGFTFKSPRHLEYKTLITQEMLARGFLATNCVYACTAHSDEILERYFAELDPIFGIIAECEEGRNIGTILRGPVCGSGFTRVN